MKIGITLDVFHSDGILLDVRDRLIINARCLAIDGATSFKMFGRKLSVPLDLFLLSLRKSFSTSFVVTERKKNRSVVCRWILLGTFQYPKGLIRLSKL